MKIKILIPIYNDWNSVKLLINNIDKAVTDIEGNFSVIIPQFLEKIVKNPDIPVVGKRVKRSENNVFKFCYEVHKILTYLFTGKLIKFGHFTCISKSVVKKMTNE